MWIAIVVDGLLGALAGIVGWLLTRRLGNEQRKKSLIPVVCVVIAVAVGNQAVVPMIKERQERREFYEAGLAIYGNPTVATVFVEAMVPVMRHPGLGAWMKKAPSSTGVLAAVPADGAQAAFARLTAMGMARVSPSELEAMFDAKRKLAEISPELCAGFWSGNIPAAQLTAGIRRLPEPDQLTWVRTTASAMTLELDGRTPARSPGDKALEAAMQKLVDGLPGAEQAALVKASGGGGSVTPGEACAAFRALADGLKNLPPEGRDVVIWGVSNPNAT